LSPECAVLLFRMNSNGGASKENLNKSAQLISLNLNKIDLITYNKIVYCCESNKNDINPFLIETIYKKFDEECISILKKVTKKRQIIFQFDHIYEYFLAWNDMDLIASTKLYLHFILDNVFYQKNDNYRIIYLLLKIGEKISESSL